MKETFIKPAHKKNNKQIDEGIIIEKYSDENISRMKDRFIELSKKHRDGELEFVKYISSNEKHRYNRLKYKYAKKEKPQETSITEKENPSIFEHIKDKVSKNKTPYLIINHCHVCGNVWKTKESTYPTNGIREHGGCFACNHGKTSGYVFKKTKDGFSFP